MNFPLELQRKVPGNTIRSCGKPARCDQPRTVHCPDVLIRPCSKGTLWTSIFRRNDKCFWFRSTETSGCPTGQVHDDYFHRREHSIQLFSSRFLPHAFLSCLVLERTEQHVFRSTNETRFDGPSQGTGGNFGFQYAATEVAAPINFRSTPYMCCCEFGVPRDCSPKTSAGHCWFTLFCHQSRPR